MDAMTQPRAEPPTDPAATPAPKISLTTAPGGLYRLELEATLPLSEVTRLLSSVEGHLSEEMARGKSVEQRDVL